MSFLSLLTYAIFGTPMLRYNTIAVASDTYAIHKCGPRQLQTMALRRVITGHQLNHCRRLSEREISRHIDVPSCSHIQREIVDTS